jgi:putative redox protein
MPKDILKASVSWQKDMEYLGKDSAGHEILFGASKAFGGTGDYPIPLEGLLATAGACIAVNTQIILRQQGMDYTYFDVEVQGTRKDEYPKIFEKIHAKIKIKGDFEKAMIEDLIKEVMTKFCPITVILGLTAELTWDFTME